MTETKELLRRGVGGFEPTPDAFEHVLTRRDRKQRNRRVAAGVLGIAVFALGALAFVRLLGSEGTPASDPRSPFAGTWVSTSDADGGTQTMTVQVFADDVVEIVVLDTIATVCGGTSSTMTGTGRIDAGTALVIPAPIYTCDDGSEAETLSGPPLEEALRDWTLVLDPETDTLSDGVGGVWLREGAEDPSPGPRVSGQMWPQTSLEEVGEAQELADAGDPGYTWQLDPVLASDDNLYPWNSEIVERFLREGLGWEQWGIGRSGVFAGQPGGPYDEVVLLRCAPGRTNPLYPEMPPDVLGCAPTIDDFRYETVMISLEQPGRRGPSGVWVVTGWEMLQPVEPGTFYEHLYPHFQLQQVEQVAPPSDAEATALLQAFLGARVDGEGAEQYVHRHRDGWDDVEVPILYATTGGSPYERYEIDRLQGPVWPSGWIEFRIHLFAEDGTEVEQSFIAVRQEDGRLGLMYGLPVDSDFFPTTEDGQPPAEAPYSLLDGEVTFAVAAPPWEEPWDGGAGDLSTFMLFGLGRSSMMIMADPLPVDPDCEPGQAPADAEALARTIRSNPYVDSTAPVAVRVAGVDALRMDVAFVASETVRPGCRELGLGPAVVEGLHHLYVDGRMRLYFLDLPDGMSARVLGIAIVASEESFEHVWEAAAPTVDSFEFHAP
jgi:hypothetical protein